MRDHYQRAFELPELVLQPSDHTAVQMVGGLVQDQHIAGTCQRGAQRHPLALAAGKHSHTLLKQGHSQPGEDGLGLIFRQSPRLGRDPGKDLLQHRIFLIKRRKLGKIVEAHIGVPAHPSLVRLLRTCQDPQEGGFSRAVDADDSQLLSRLQVEGHPVQHLPCPVGFRNLFRR